MSGGSYLVIFGTLAIFVTEQNTAQTNCISLYFLLISLQTLIHLLQPFWYIYRTGTIVNNRMTCKLHYYSATITYIV